MWEFKTSGCIFFLLNLIPSAKSLWPFKVTFTGSGDQDLDILGKRYYSAFHKIDSVSFSDAENEVQKFVPGLTMFQSRGLNSGSLTFRTHSEPAFLTIAHPWLRVTLKYHDLIG